MRKLIVSLVLLLTAGLFVYLCIQINFIQDDAFITFRYVDNFINGNGLVFNPGEYVEGYTSFLWLMVLSLLAWLKLDYVSLSQYISVAFSVFTLQLTYLLASQFDFKNSTKLTSTLFNLVPVVMLALTGGFHYWAVSGMETGFFVFLILSSVYLYLKQPDKFWYLLILLFASLTRPEGILFSAIILVHGAIVNNKYRSTEIWFVQLVKLYKKELIFYVLPFAVYLIFRLIYYDNLLPNTFYAKTGFGLFYLDRGLDYLSETFSHYLYYGVMLLFPLILFKNREVGNKTILFYILIGFSLLSVLLVGGDVLPLHRFMLPVLPFIYILFSKSAEQIIQKMKSVKFRNVLTVLAGILLTFLSFQAYRSELPRINDLRGYEQGLVKKMKIYSKWINDQAVELGRKPTVCLSTIGAFSYYSNANVIDLIGLTDEYIAHNPREVKGIAGNVDVLWKERRYNVEYIMDREPDYIIMPAGAKPSAYPESALFTRLKFLGGYYPQLFYSEELGQYLPVFSKKPGIEYIKDEQVDCSVGFINHYIQAQNDFLEYLQTGDEELISSVENHCKNILDSCSRFGSYARTVLGYTYYHSGNLSRAREELEKSVEADNYNCLSLVYLISIYSNTGMHEKREEYIRLLKKYSPDALPNLELKF